MTAPVPDYRPPAGAAPADPAGSTTPRTAAPVNHPKAPTPPRSRVGGHVLSLFAGVVLMPIAIVLLSAGIRTIVTAAAAGQAPSTASLAAVLGAAGLFGVVAGAAAGSAGGPIVAGTVFGVAPGVGFLLWPDRMTDYTRTIAEPFVGFGGDTVRAGAIVLGETAGVLVIGLTIVAVGIAAAIARRSAKKAEREDAVAIAESTPSFAGERVPPPPPPRTRRLDHLVALAVGILMLPVAVVLVCAGSAEVARAAERGSPVDLELLLGSGLLGSALLIGVVLTAGWSTAGLLVGSLAFLVVPGAMGLLLPDFADRAVGGVLAELGVALDPMAPTGLSDLTALGVLLVWGATAFFGALGIHGARRDGRRRERAELALRPAQPRW